MIQNLTQVTEVINNCQTKELFWNYVRKIVTPLALFSHRFHPVYLGSDQSKFEIQDKDKLINAYCRDYMPGGAESIDFAKHFLYRKRSLSYAFS